MKRILKIEKQESLKFLRAFCENSWDNFMEAEEGSQNGQEFQICWLISFLLLGEKRVNVAKAEESFRKMFGDKFSERGFVLAIMSIEKYL